MAARQQWTTLHNQNLAFAACPLSGVKRTSRLRCEMSAYDPKRTSERFRRLTEVDFFSEGPTTSTIGQMLLTRILRFRAGGSSSVLPPEAGPQKQEPGVMLVHGTNFPPDRPVWSVPGLGPLFKHIAAFRSDIYRNQDYFRWEGGYSDYAREVASLNLNDWVERRGLLGIDAVTHSHGGSVLMAATNLGLIFDKVVFLSCPVHWPQYMPRHASIRKPQSVRIHLDLVLLADRAGQRFPVNTIPEDVLPIWFLPHGVTCEPATWIARKLDKYIR